MTKAKEKSGSARTEETLDYQQLAEHMLGSWQDQWRQFANNKDNPFASAYGDWMNSWSSAMGNWSGAQNPAQPAAPTTATKTEETTKHAAASTTAPTATAQPEAPRAATTETRNAGTTQTVPPAAAAPSNARDVLLTELARRVEFLHERVVSLENELERLKTSSK